MNKSIFSKQKQKFEQADIIVQMVYVWVFLFFTSLVISQYTPIDRWLALNTEEEGFLLKPWTLVTYAFFVKGNDLMSLLIAIGLLLFFGKKFRYYFSKRIFLRVYFLGIIFAALMGIIIRFFGGMINIMTLLPGVYAIMTMYICYQSKERLQLYFFGNVELRQVGYFLIGIELFSALMNRSYAVFICYIAAALAGYLYLYQFNKGDFLGRIFYKYTKK